MKNRLLAGLLAGALVFQSAGTAYAAENAADLSSSADKSLTEAASNGASLVMSENDEKTDEAGDGAGNGDSSTAVSTVPAGDDIEIEIEEEGEEGSAADTASKASSEAASEGSSVEGDESGDASSEASSGASDEDAADAASSETSYPESFFDENATGFLDVDKGYDIQSVTELPSGNRKRLLRSASYPEYYVTSDLPDLRNQNPYGSCWAFAMIGLSEINLIQNSYYGYDLSELHLAYFAYHSVVDPLGGLEGDDVTFSGPAPLSLGGNSDFAAYTLTRWTGAADEASANYVQEAETAVKSGLDPAIAYNDVVHLIGYYEDKYSTDDLTPVKRMVTTYGGAGINFYAYNSMAAVTDEKVYNKTNNCYYNDTYKQANHAVIIVGWDDNFSRDNFSTKPSGDGAWLIRNSWTTGNDESYSGYFWMSYYEATIDDDIYAVECRPVDMGYDNNYQYDGGLGGGKYQPYQAANVFTARSGCEYGESLEAVSFKTPDSNVSYTIDIYKSLTDSKNPISGDLAATVTGSTTFAGFYEVELDEPVLLDEGETFSVVVRLSKGGEIASICLDNSTSASQSGYGTVTSVINTPAGQGFYRFSENAGWTDLGTKWQRNFRIKAYTNDQLPPDLIYPETIRFDEVVGGRFSLGVNSSHTIAYTILPEDASDKSMKWTTSDPNVCKVSANGIITGVSKGTATITGTTVIGHVTASFEVDVDYVLTSIQVSGYTTPRIGNSIKFLAYANPRDYEFKESITWSSSDPTIASVSSDGTVKALKAGTATINASADGKTGSIKVNVFIPESAYDMKVRSDNSVKITWNAVEGATAYDILRNDAVIATLSSDAVEYVDDYYVERTSGGETVSYTFRYIIGGLGYRCTRKLNLNKRYKVTYHLGEGGKENNPDNPGFYTGGVGAALYDPVPANKCTFIGWYSDEAGNRPKTAILDTDSGDMDIYGFFDKSYVGAVEIITEGDDSGRISVGDTARIHAAVLSDNGTDAPEDDTYEISYICNPGGDEPAAEITSTGTDKATLSITGRRSGSVTVTVTSNGLGRGGNRISASKTFMITAQPPKSILLTASAEAGVDVGALKVGQKLKLEYNIMPESASQSSEWTVSNEEVAGIEVHDGYAVVTARSVGTAYISAVSETDASVRNGYWIEVVEDGTAPEERRELRIVDTSKNPVIYGSSSYEADSGSEEEADSEASMFPLIELAPGKSFALKAELLPNEAFASRNVAWTSGDSAVAAVNSAGKITAKSAGYTVITAVSEEGQLEAACKVNVYAPVTSFALDKKTLKLPRRGSGIINVSTLLPTSASDVVTFESSNASVASVNMYTGVVTAGDVNGTAVITATTAHGEKKAKCTVTVGNPVTSIEVKAKGNATSLAVGKTLQLSAVFNAKDNAPQPLNKEVEWNIVSGSSFATISSKGVLKGVKEGRVTVRAVSTSDEVPLENIEDLTIDIYVPITKASLSVKSLTIDRGASYKLTVNFTTPNGEAPTGDTVGRSEPMRIDLIPSEGNEGIITYSDTDEWNSKTITGLSCNNKFATVYVIYHPYGKNPQVLNLKVKVTNPYAGLSKFTISSNKITMDEGTTAQLTGKFTPMAPREHAIFWEVDDAASVYLLENGEPVKSMYTGLYDNNDTVTFMAADDALSSGSNVATIKATTLGTDSTGLKTFEAECTVTIKDKAGYIQLKSGRADVTDGAISLAKGKNMTLKQAVFTDEGMFIKSGNQKVRWNSEDTSVATVNSAGKIVGVGNGTTRIWADTTDAVTGDEGVYSDAASFVDVTVYNAPTKLTLDKKKTSLSTRLPKETRYSSLSQYDVVTANITPLAFYTNPSVDGDVSYSRITWTANSDIIEVRAIDTSWVNSGKNVHEKQELLKALDISGENGYHAINSGSFVTTGQDQSVAIVARKPGTVKLTATTPGGKKAVCTITVYSSVTDLKVEEGRITEASASGYDYKTTLKLEDKTGKSVTVVPLLEIGGVPYSAAKTTEEEKTATAAYNAVKKLAVNTSVNYRSSNIFVASVSAKGVITAKNQGSAVITVSTADGSITKRILVVVE